MTVEDLLTTLSDCTSSVVKIDQRSGTYVKFHGVSVAMLPEKILKLNVVEWWIHHTKASDDYSYIFIKTF